MVGGGEGLGIVSGTGAVSEAIRSVAKEGAAAGDVENTERVGVAEDDGFGPVSVLKEPVEFGLADSFGRAGGIGFGFFTKSFVKIGAVEIGAMFPDVARHVVEAEGVGRVGFDGGGA